jgi:hypothetical protein
MKKQHSPGHSIQEVWGAEGVSETEESGQLPGFSLGQLVDDQAITTRYEKNSHIV